MNIIIKYCLREHSLAKKLSRKSLHEGLYKDKLPKYSSEIGIFLVFSACDQYTATNSCASTNISRWPNSRLTIFSESKHCIQCIELIFLKTFFPHNNTCIAHILHIMNPGYVLIINY